MSGVSDFPIAVGKPTRMQGNRIKSVYFPPWYDNPAVEKTRHSHRFTVGSPFGAAGGRSFSAAV